MDYGFLELLEAKKAFDKQFKKTYKASLKAKHVLKAYQKELKEGRK